MTQTLLFMNRQSVSIGALRKRQLSRGTQLGVLSRLTGLMRIEQRYFTMFRKFRLQDPDH